MDTKKDVYHREIFIQCHDEKARRNYRHTPFCLAGVFDLIN